MKVLFFKSKNKMPFLEDKTEKLEKIAVPFVNHKNSKKLLVLIQLVSLAIYILVNKFNIISTDFPIETGPLKGFLYLFIVPILFALHETLHIIFTPHFYKKDAECYLIITTLIGVVDFIPKTKNREITLLIAPFLFITVIPLALSFLFGTFNAFISYMAIVNMFSSGMDITQTIYAIKNVPKGATVISMFYID